MNVSRSFVSRPFCWLAGALLACAAASPVEAQVATITALFKPDSARPHLNKFTNTTPPSGYCANYPQQCEANQFFSLQVPIQFNSRAPIPANHSSPRQGAMLKVPAQWRELTVHHETTGDPQKVRVRIAGIGSKAVTDDVKELVGGADDYQIAHNRLWGASWVYAPSPCQTSGNGYYGTYFYLFFWKTPIVGACAKQAKFDVPWLRFDYLDFGYELETPNPLGMASGQYTGSLTYSVGPNGDFDFGDVLLPTDSALTLDFNLDVQHTLKVDIPPGGEKLQLVPAGGWQSWLHAGRKPVRLFRDQTFHISASSRFKMYFECERWSTYDCVIKDAIGRRPVELRVGVSLPNGLTDLSGQPVKHQRLKWGPEGAQIFQPGFYVDRAPGVLHFEVPEYEVEWMLQQPNIASPYTGRVTVIWDSEV
ncbi:Secreted protein [Pseudomonas sp. IT-P74]|uniref:Uncharacterized protein n=1 Tax=Pseudomonas fluorescens TaxID=294 RepID=A0A5E7U597_PSEFL|nr:MULTISPECIES: hypothetical protein [Pseudomonas]PBJ25375.1 hypothetical protein BSF44_16320 [Pseudomonas sp. ACN8]VVQ05256.1 hypothetical protein PS938_02906 [Pseudomonas fluorescens]